MKGYDMTYYKIHYTNIYDEVNAYNFEIVDDYYQMLEVSEYYYNNPYYTDVYITEVKG